MFVLRNSIKHEFGVPKFVEPSGMNQARVPRPVDHKRKSLLSFYRKLSSVPCRYLPELKKVGLSPDKVVRARQGWIRFENGVQNDACPPACESVLPLFPAEARIRGSTIKSL